MAKFIVRGQEEEEEEVPIVEEASVVDEAAVEEEEAAQEEEALTVTIGEDADEDIGEQGAPGWVKEVRKRNRELERELRDLRKQAQAAPVVEPALGPKPTLETADYDAEKYETALADWLELKRKADDKAAEAKKTEEAANAAWKNKLAALDKAKTALGADDYEDAEALVISELNTVQQGILVHGAKNAALLVYALGKNPAATKKLAGIKDPVEFAFAVARLEVQMKVSGKKPATPPEDRVISSARPSGGDATLERLRAKAEKTGDYTQVRAYKDKLKARQ